MNLKLNSIMASRIINKQRKNFTTVSNSFLQDKNISWKTKGIIIYIMHLPPDWAINISDL